MSEAIERARWKAAEQALERVDSPSLTPLSTSQERFIWLHARRIDYVVKWCWLLGGTQLRAFTIGGHTATIAEKELDDLVERGLMKRGHGHQVDLTAAGWAMGKQTCTV